MPTPYPNEFRRDVVAVARRGEQSRAQVARSFGAHPNPRCSEFLNPPASRSDLAM